MPSSFPVLADSSRLFIFQVKFALGISLDSFDHVIWFCDSNIPSWYSCMNNIHISQMEIVCLQTILYWNVIHLKPWVWYCEHELNIWELSLSESFNFDCSIGTERSSVLLFCGNSLCFLRLDGYLHNVLWRNEVSFQTESSLLNSFVLSVNWRMFPLLLDNINYCIEISHRFECIIHIKLWYGINEKRQLLLFILRRTSLRLHCWIVHKSVVQITLCTIRYIEYRCRKGRLHSQ